jgi:lactoylglutathione lyase
MTHTVEGAGLRLELFVDEVARSLHWYCDGLGFEPDPEPDSVEPGTYRPIRRGAVRLSLQAFRTLSHDHPLRRAGDEAPRGVGVEIVLELADVDELTAVHARAVDAGLAPTPLVRQPWGLTDFRLADPDGYYLRITTAPSSG